MLLVVCMLFLHGFHLSAHLKQFLLFSMQLLSKIFDLRREQEHNNNTEIFRIPFFSQMKIIGVNKSLIQPFSIFSKRKNIKGNSTHGQKLYLKVQKKETAYIRNSKPYPHSSALILEVNTLLNVLSDTSLLQSFQLFPLVYKTYISILISKKLANNFKTTFCRNIVFQKYTFFINTPALLWPKTTQI